MRGNLKGGGEGWRHYSVGKEILIATGIITVILSEAKNLGDGRNATEILRGICAEECLRMTELKDQPNEYE